MKSEKTILNMVLCSCFSDIHLARAILPKMFFVSHSSRKMNCGNLKRNQTCVGDQNIHQHHVTQQITHQNKQTLTPQHTYVIFEENFLMSRGGILKKKACPRVSLGVGQVSPST